VNIVWSGQARADLRAIRDFIARDSEFYASRMVARLIERVERAAQSPTAGHPVHEYHDLPLREVHESSYRIIYRSSDNFFEVVTLVHLKQQLPLESLG
jgi:toxin ParE1/3/4